MNMEAEASSKSRGREASKTRRSGPLLLGCLLAVHFSCGGMQQAEGTIRDRPGWRNE